jgi:hypothetical protein
MAPAQCQHHQATLLLHVRMASSLPFPMLINRLIELELDGNAGLSGCLPQGAPAPERLCGVRGGPACPGFTADRLIGTATSGTRLSRQAQARRLACVPWWSTAWVAGCGGREGRRGRCFLVVCRACCRAMCPEVEGGAAVLQAGLRCPEVSDYKVRRGGSRHKYRASMGSAIVGCIAPRVV